MKIDTIYGETFTEAFIKAAQVLLRYGKEIGIHRENATDNSTVEIMDAKIVVNNPKHRISMMENRGGNPFAQLYEVLWVLSGSRDITGLKRFLPRAPQWADNGYEWRAGYGARLRHSMGLDDEQYTRFYNCFVDENRPVYNFHAKGIKNVDQLMYVYNTLMEDPSSRQAVMTIWDPAKDCTISATRDIPCSNHIQFLVRDNALHCMVTMRSNDLLWGFGAANMFEFSYIQEMLANALGYNVGKYSHRVGSLHYYKKYEDKLVEAIGCYHSDPDLQTMGTVESDNLPAWSSLATRNFRKICAKIDNAAESEKGWIEEWKWLSNWESDETLNTIRFLMAYLIYKHTHTFADFLNVIGDVYKSDTKLMGIHYVMRLEDKEATVAEATRLL